MTTTQDRTCPECQSEMAFAPDGLGLLCERCGYRHRIKRALPPVQELARAQRLLANAANHSPQRVHNIRAVLRLGVAAVKEGNKDEAFSHLQRVILSSDSSDKVRATAWLWLSQVYKEPAAKRDCLEQTISYDPGNATARRGLALLDGRLQAGDIIDPEKLSRDAPVDPQAVRVAQFACPRCAGRMNYVADGRTLRCEFCGFEQQPDAEGETAVQPEFGIGEMEQDFIATMAQASGHLQPVATRTFLCNGCASEFVLAPETLSVTCPYCNHVYVTETHETKQILPPQAIIPFAIAPEDAQKRVYRWLKEQKLAPKQITPLHGIYLPIWTFDLSGDLPWRGMVRRGDDWVPRNGIGHVLHDDFLVPANGQKSKLLRKCLHDFDLTALVAYDARYLADWPAERYQLAMADASLEARRSVLKEIRRKSFNLTGGEDVRDLTINSTNLSILSYKLILLPVYLLRYRIEDDAFEVVVDGQNGRVYADRPSSTLGKLFSWLKGD